MKIIKRVFIILIILLLVFFGTSFAIVAYGTSIRPIRYQEEINKYSKENDLDPLFVAAVVDTESGFRPEAESHQGAMGLMQLLPDTAKWVCERIDEPYDVDKLQEPEYNLKLGTYYLKWLVDHFKDYDLALAAYNGGIGNVEKWLKDENISKDGKTLHNIPFGETRNYVRKVNNSYEIFQLFYRQGLKENNIGKIQLYWRNYKNMLKNMIADF